jgi:secondary thiamine-phosphate synthase enzyme
MVLLRKNMLVSPKHAEVGVMQTAELNVSTVRRTQFVPISAQLAELVVRSRWQDGILTVFVPHTTAGITINENADPDVARDMEQFCDQFIPPSSRFRHAEGNSDSHLKASFFGSSLQIIVRNGSMWLGTWQGVYFCEFDGPRRRTVQVAFTGE